VTGKVARGDYAIGIKLLRKDGAVEWQGQAEVEHLGPRGRVVLKAIEDAYVDKGSPTTNRGTAKSLLVDGGEAQMGDESHQITYLKFRIDIPGKPVSAVLRLHNAGNPTSDSGNAYLVTQAWSEKQITYEKRPKLGKQLAKIGPVKENQTVKLPLKVSLKGLAELSLAVDPVNLDGTDYFSREGGRPAELVVEYEE